MTLEAQVKLLREALESVRYTHENSRRAVSKGSAPYTAALFWACYGSEVDAALAATAETATHDPMLCHEEPCEKCATAEPVKPEALRHSHEHEWSEPSPAPRDAEREHDADCSRVRHGHCDCERAALLAFGEKVREACSEYARSWCGKEHERAIDNIDLAALLQVKP